MIVIGYQKAGFEDEIIDVVFEEHEDRDDAEDALNRLVLTQDTIEDTLLHYFWAIIKLWLSKIRLLTRNKSD